MPQRGLLVPGNIDTSAIAPVANPDGSVSTVRSISIEQDGKQVLIPTVVGGRVVSNDEAINQYKKTGKHLGIFDTSSNATDYAQSLHESEARRVRTMPQQTVKELGQLVKQKYAGSYDDLSDEDLGKQIKAKYPGSYDDYADAPVNGPAPDSSSAAAVMARRTGDVLSGLGAPSVETVKNALRHPLDTGMKIAKYIGTGRLAEDAVSGIVKAPYALGKAFVESAPTAYKEAEALFSTSPNYKGPPVQMPSEVEQAGAANAAGRFTANVPAVAGEAALLKSGVKAAIPAVRSAATEFADKFKPDPVSTWVRALKPGKNIPDFAVDTAAGPSKVSTALDEIAQHADDTGKPILTTQDAREALQARAKVYMDSANGVAKKILNPRRGIEVPGSGQALATAQIDAIPEDIRLRDPIEYERLVNKAKTIADKNFTIGELDDIRQGTGAKPGAGQKNIKASLVLDENAAAMDKAAASASRNLLYDEVNKWSGGTPNSPSVAGSAFREANRRLSAIIENQDLVEGKTNRAIAQNKSPAAQRAEMLGKVLSPAKSLKELSTGASATINEDIASAVRRWEGRPVPIPDQPLAYRGSARQLTTGQGEVRQIPASTLPNGYQMNVTTGEPLPRNDPYAAAPGSAPSVKLGPAKGMQLIKIEYDPVSGLANRYTYADPASGTQKTFTTRQK